VTSMLGRALLRLCTLCLAAAVSFVLFITIPELQDLLGIEVRPAQRAASQPRVLAQAVRQAKPKPPPTRGSVRQVRASAGAPTSSASMGSGPPSRFSPDLSVEGGGGVAVAAAGTMQAEVFEEGQTDEDAVPVFSSPVPYPDRARELGVEGVLEVVFVVDVDGKVSSLEIVRSPHASITAAAKKTIAQWRFKPARNKSVPVRVRIRQVVEFKLD